MTLRLERHYGDRVMRCFDPRPESLAALLRGAVARNPEGEALIDGPTRLTYRALATQVGAVAAGLAARGVGAGDRVAMLLGNRAEFVILLFAITRLGAIAVPLSIREQRPGLLYLLGHCGAVLCVFEDFLAPLLPAPEAVPALRHRLPVSAFADLAGPGVIEADAPVGEEDVALLLYTSGTTGRPKGAMLTHLGLVHSVLHCMMALELGAGERVMAAVPMAHVTGIVPVIATTIHAAGALLVLPEFKARAFLDLAERERLTYTIIVPAMYALLLLEPDFATRDLSAWRIGAFGGAPMPEAVIARLAATLPHLRLINGYGATETTSPATFLPAHAIADHAASVGLSVPCGEIVVMDEAGREVPRGEIGEIWIRGPMVVPGYWQDEAATAENFTAGFWHSGDLGMIDAAGYVFIRDRGKDMINRGGENVYCVEVENVLAGAPGVFEVAVVAVTDPVMGEKVGAVVVPVPGTELDVAAVLDHASAHLADFKVPQYVAIRTDPLPRNPGGKVRKPVLRSETQWGGPLR
jgi:long-chain acyl-CoA synthetase